MWSPQLVCKDCRVVCDRHLFGLVSGIINCNSKECPNYLWAVEEPPHSLTFSWGPDSLSYGLISNTDNKKKSSVHRLQLQSDRAARLHTPLIHQEHGGLSARYSESFRNGQLVSYSRKSRCFVLTHTHILYSRDHLRYFTFNIYSWWIGAKSDRKVMVCAMLLLVPYTSIWIYTSPIYHILVYNIYIYILVNIYCWIKWSC